MAAERSDHWYDRETGNLVSQVERAKPKLLNNGEHDHYRAPTLRDARKHGYLPSPTSIIDILGSFQLVQWKQDQAAYAANQYPYDDGDLPGPVPIAVAGTVAFAGMEGGSKEALLAVFGDSDFASNQMLGRYQNRDLFVNTVNWLLGDVEAISVRPNRSRASGFQMSASQKRAVQLLALFAIPEFLAVVGVYIWWTRRQTARR